MRHFMMLVEPWDRYEYCENIHLTYDGRSLSEALWSVYGDDEDEDTLKEHLEENNLTEEDWVSMMESSNGDGRELVTVFEVTCLTPLKIKLVYGWS